jgi:hypothetical protein
VIFGNTPESSQTVVPSRFLYSFSILRAFFEAKDNQPRQKVEALETLAGIERINDCQSEANAAKIAFST